MKIKILSLFIILGCIQTKTHAQEPKSHEKSFYQDADGHLFWNRYLPFFLSISSSKDEKGVLLQSEKTKDYANPAYFDTEGLNYIRTRYTVNPETFKAVTPHAEIMWEVYADGIAPDTKAHFEKGTKFQTKETTYFGKNMEVRFTASDKTSGVKQSYFSISDLPYSPVDSVYRLDQEGKYNLRYYSVDYVGNVEEPKNKSFVIDYTEPQSKLNISGEKFDYVVGKKNRFTLDVHDELSGISKVYYAFDQDEPTLYSLGKVINKNQLNDGEHQLSFYAVDHVGNREEKRVEKFYLDKLPPLLASDILGDRFYANDRVYFSGRTKLKLTSVDNKSGVAKTYYSINQEKFDDYKQPFYLPNVSGEHVVRYYSEDKLGNSTRDESKNEALSQYKYNIDRVYVDLTGPTLSHKFKGPQFKKRNNIYISSETSIVLKATDTESGLHHISYSLRNTFDEITYKMPFSLKDEGKHQIELFSYDNVNNRNKTKLNLLVDNTPPEISYTFSVPPYEEIIEELPVYPKYLEIYIAATDKKVGNDKFQVSINDGPLQDHDGKVTGFISKQKNTLKIVASDKLGNQSEVETSFWLN